MLSIGQRRSWSEPDLEGKGGRGRKKRGRERNSKRGDGREEERKRKKVVERGTVRGSEEREKYTSIAAAVTSEVRK